MRDTDPDTLLAAALAVCPPGPLRVAFSGGLDSTALLHALAASPAARARDLAAIHVDHGLTPDSGAWAERCRRQCADLRVPLTVHRVTVARDADVGLEAAARAARHAVFAEQLPPGGVLLCAHHADDQAETVLLRLMRSAGVDGLAGMRPLRRFAQGWLARPWLTLPRAAIRAWATARGLTAIEDPANRSLAHDRNRIRHAVLPMLAARWPDAATRIAESARLLRGAADVVGERADALLARARRADPAWLDADALAALDPFLRGEVLRRAALTLGLPPPPATVLARVGPELLACAPDAEPLLAWDGGEARRYRDGVTLRAPDPPLDAEWRAEWTGEAPLTLPAGLGVLALEPATPFAFTVGFRRGGETLRLAPGRHAQPLKHALQALGLPPWERVRLPLLWHGGALVAAGDLLLTEPLRAALSARGTRLCWRRPALIRDGA